MSFPLPVLAQVESTATGVIDVVLILIIFGIVFGWVGKAMSSKVDKSWLPRLVLWGFIAKMAGALARFYMVTVLLRER